MKNTAPIAAGRRSPQALAQSFDDLHPRLSAFAARVEADRCYFCHDAPCLTACPTAIDIPLFIRQIALGDAKAAARTIFSSNIMGGSCARVCPTEDLCEGACVRMAAEGKPVEIGKLQRFATDVFLETEKLPRSAGHKRLSAQKIAIIGAGPAGLACARHLAESGARVTVFDARSKAGGLNEYGIAVYKTPHNFAQQEVATITEIEGISLRLECRLGENITLKGLMAEHAAVFLALGLGGSRALGVPGEDLAGVRPALEAIAELRQTADLTTYPIGQRVLVIGGGMTAIDIAVQAKYLGAETVTLLARRGIENMRASPVARKLATDAGVYLRPWAAPTAFLGRQGQLTAAVISRCDDQGRPQDGLAHDGLEPEELPIDQAFIAIGQQLAAQDQLQDFVRIDQGRILADGNGKTSHLRIWAGGDCTNQGEDLTVTAVAQGKKAAQAMVDQLTEYSPSQ